MKMEKKRSSSVLNSRIHHMFTSFPASVLVSLSMIYEPYYLVLRNILKHDTGTIKQPRSIIFVPLIFLRPTEHAAKKQTGLDEEHP
jgi:hypothetical protein